MATATGEAATYEQALAQIDAMLDDLADIGTHLEGIDTEVRELNTAMSGFTDRLAGLNLDAGTLSLTGAVADTFSPDTLKALFEALDAARAQLTAARAQLVATYGDAAATVATTGVEAEFLAA